MAPEILNKRDRAFGGWEPEASDIVILMLGQTGSGKSTFINVAAANNVAQVTDAYTACTKDITPFTIQHPKNNTRIVLVDTPGFNDTWSDDLVVLKRIVEWLKQLERKVKATGIIYLHEITQPRVFEDVKSHMSPIRLARPGMAKIMRNVVLVTTKWEDLPSQSTGAHREQELFAIWRTLLDEGSTTSRFENERDSAWGIIDRIKQDKNNEASISQELSSIFGQLPEKSKTTHKYGFFTSLFGSRQGRMS